jgi:hypothetical protein
MSKAMPCPEKLGQIKDHDITRLDVRPVLAQGSDPLDAILSTIEGLQAEGVLRLEAPFVPMPLVGLLSGSGWKSWIEKTEPGYCLIWFYRD